MEYNQFEVQEELPQKEFKKHPIIAIVLFSMSLLSVLTAVALTLLDQMEQLYTCFYAASLLMFVLGFNCLMKFKGFCLIFYPIIVLYGIISSYGFASDLSILQLQFPILATIVIGVYFVQALYELIRKKKILNIILPSILFTTSIVLISLITIIGQKLTGTIISALILPIIAYELSVLIIDFKNKKYAKVEEPAKKEEIIEDEIKGED